MPISPNRLKTKRDGNECESLLASLKLSLIPNFSAYSVKTETKERKRLKRLELIKYPNC